MPQSAYAVHPEPFDSTVRPELVEGQTAALRTGLVPARGGSASGGEGRTESTLRIQAGMESSAENELNQRLQPAAGMEQVRREAGAWILAGIRILDTDWGVDRLVSRVENDLRRYSQASESVRVVSVWEGEENQQVLTELFILMEDQARTIKPRVWRVVFSKSDRSRESFYELVGLNSVAPGVFVSGIEPRSVESLLSWVRSSELDESDVQFYRYDLPAAGMEGGQAEFSRRLVELQKRGPDRDGWEMILKALRAEKPRAFRAASVTLRGWLQVDPLRGDVATFPEGEILEVIGIYAKNLVHTSSPLWNRTSAYRTLMEFARDSDFQEPLGQHRGKMESLLKTLPRYGAYLRQIDSVRRVLARFNELGIDSPADGTEGDQAKYDVVMKVDGPHTTGQVDVLQPIRGRLSGAIDVQPGEILLLYQRHETNDNMRRYVALVKIPESGGTLQMNVNGWKEKKIDVTRNSHGSSPYGASDTDTWPRRVSLNEPWQNYPDTRVEDDKQYDWGIFSLNGDSTKLTVETDDFPATYLVAFRLESAAGMEGGPWSGYVHPWEAGEVYAGIWIAINRGHLLGSNDRPSVSSVVEGFPALRDAPGFDDFFSVTPVRKQEYLLSQLETLVGQDEEDFLPNLATVILVSELLLYANFRWNLGEASNPDEMLRIIRRGIEVWYGHWDQVEHRQEEVLLREQIESLDSQERAVVMRRAIDLFRVQAPGMGERRENWRGPLPPFFASSILGVLWSTLEDSSLFQSPAEPMNVRDLLEQFQAGESDPGQMQQLVLVSKEHLDFIRGKLIHLLVGLDALPDSSTVSGNELLFRLRFLFGVSWVLEDLWESNQIHPDTSDSVIAQEMIRHLALADIRFGITLLQLGDQNAGTPSILNDKAMLGVANRLVSTLRGTSSSYAGMEGVERVVNSDGTFSASMVTKTPTGRDKQRYDTIEIYQGQSDVVVKRLVIDKPRDADITKIQFFDDLEAPVLVALLYRDTVAVWVQDQGWKRMVTDGQVHKRVVGNLPNSFYAAGMEGERGAGGERQETGVMLLDPTLSRAPFTLPLTAAGMEETPSEPTPKLKGGQTILTLKLRETRKSLSQESWGVILKVLQRDNPIELRTALRVVRDWLEDSTSRNILAGFSRDAIRSAVDLMSRHLVYHPSKQVYGGASRTLIAFAQDSRFHPYLKKAGADVARYMEEVKGLPPTYATQRLDIHRLSITSFQRELQRQRIQDPTSPAAGMEGVLIELKHKLVGHGGGVWSVAFSPDGVKIVSGGEDKTVRIWNPVTGNMIGTAQEVASLVRSVAVSPGGHILAFTEGLNIQLWDFKTLKHLRTLEGHTKSVGRLAFHPDESKKMIASAGSDGSVRVWNVEDGKPIHVLKAHDGLVLHVAFNPVKNLLASGGADDTAKIWDLSTGQLYRDPMQHANWVRNVAFSPDGKIIASAGNNLIVQSLDASGEDAVSWRVSFGPGKNSRALAFSPGGKYLAVGFDRGGVRFRDVSTGTIYGRNLKGHEMEVTSLTFSPDGTILASSSLDRSINLWDLSKFLPQFAGLSTAPQAGLEGEVAVLEEPVVSAEPVLIQSAIQDSAERLRIHDLNKLNVMVVTEKVLLENPSLKVLREGAQQVGDVLLALMPEQAEARNRLLISLMDEEREVHFHLYGTPDDLALKEFARLADGVPRFSVVKLTMVGEDPFFQSHFRQLVFNLSKVEPTDEELVTLEDLLTRLRAA